MIQIAVACFGAAGELSRANILLGLMVASAMTKPTLAQVAGGGVAQGRVGGISYVTRRMPTSVAGSQAGAFFGAGGVSGLPGGSAAGGGTVCWQSLRISWPGRLTPINGPWTR